MKIRLKLIATYRRLLPAGTQGNTILVEVPPGTTVAEALRPYGVPLDESSVILLNGRHTSLDARLQDDDEVAAFSAVAGG